MRFLICLIFLMTNVQAQTLTINQLKLPPGFSIEVYAKIPNARQMVLGSHDTLFIGSKELGKVYALSHDKKSGKKVRVIAQGLNMPSGLEFKDGALYVAALNRILRFDDIENHLDKPPQPIILTQTLPKDTWHGWRYIRFGRDNKLYMGIGSPCNTCISQDKRFATISRMDKSAKQFEIYAKGVRNSVGFDWDPISGYLWFTDNGRDLLGDNLPADEINYTNKAGLDFGFPFCYGSKVIDKTYQGRDCNNTRSPIYKLPAHVAAIGMRFYTGKLFPKAYQQQIFIAEHGSWNRNKKIGYQVVLATLTNDRKHIQNVKPFISGWLQGDSVWGRPVDVLTMKDGSLLVSDDFAGVIYRVTYNSNPIKPAG